ncbi:MAG: hypothetical protein LVQ95_01460 [Candidatus Micrarchaeales archaeon]|nr:hypothetical protein [Candidatus Micrarchaeales archaeon]
MYILGVWDGHDAGAALIEDGEVVFAANEERFTRRKLEVKFPVNSIAAALSHANLKPSDIEDVSFTTTEFTKTLSRVFPAIKENYYQFRRRKMLKPRVWDIKHNHWLKYTMTSIGIVPGSTAVSRAQVSRELRHMGFGNFKLDVVEHHTAHAATAAFTSGMKRALVVTLDGVGDGLCGSISTLENGKLERRQAIRSRDSVGIFYEQVTNILGMREQEDEGKVMAMACYSYPFQYEENKFRDFFKVEGTQLSAKYSWLKQYDVLSRISWQMPREQFAYMAQQTLEYTLGKLISNAMDRYNMHDVVLAGGIFANVKANMVIRNLEQLKHWYVFPHMGDGGIALGSALYTSYRKTGKSDYGFSAYLGDGYSTDETAELIRGDRSLAVQKETPMENASHAAELIDKGNYLMWFQGRMEYGPRALGDRSILARSDDEDVKEKLNIHVKKREWFQPFCPSMLESEAGSILEYDSKGVDKFMTMAYRVRHGKRDLTRSVMHIDGTARPQMVGEENRPYQELLKGVKKRTGAGVVLNTSFNLHGFPIVRTPQDAIDVMKSTKTKYMFINGLFITNRAGV